MNNYCRVTSLLGEGVQVVLCDNCISHPDDFIASAISAIGVECESTESCAWCGAPGVEPDRGCES